VPSTTVSRQTSTYTVELTVTDAPALKVEYVYYTVTGLRITYDSDTLTKLVVIGVAEDTGETEELATRLTAYEMVQPWIRAEVDKHRPGRNDTRWARKCQENALERAGEAIEEEAWPHEKPERENEELYRLADRVRGLPALDICWCGREKQPGEDHGMCYPAMD
jgi:hypothetical protein